MPLSHRTSHRAVTSALAVAVLLLAGCTGGPDEKRDGDAAPTEGADGPASTTVTLVTPDSVTLNAGLLERFELESGLTVEVNVVGDAGTFAEQILASKEGPLGDVVLGVDNTFMSRVVNEGVTEVNYLWQVGHADVCVNADKVWFDERDVPLPGSLEDLAQPRYKGQLVVPDPATSALGLAFLLAAVDEYGDTGAGDYWKALRENGVKFASSPEAAYDVDFTASNSTGGRPLVVSYSTSPAGTAGKDGEFTTAALPETCFRHEEYAGLLTGAKNRAGAKDLLAFLVSDEVQQEMSTSMSVYPADDDTRVPDEWAEVPRMESPHELDPEQIGENRDAWISAWTSTMFE